MGRFLNFDNYGGQIGELLGHNGYCYCKNNPTNMIDSTGKVSASLIIGGIALLAVGVIVITTPPEVWEAVGQIITDIGSDYS